MMLTSIKQGLYPIKVHLSSDAVGVRGTLRYLNGRTHQQLLLGLRGNKDGAWLHDMVRLILA